MLNGLDLFSGIGGISMGLRRWVNTVAYCEYEPFCQTVLLSKVQSGELERAPIWDDVRTLTVENFGHSLDIDIILAGFPCQNISVAGDGTGLEGDRSGLYFQVLRLVEEIKPTYVFLENVPAIRVRGLLAVVVSLANLGYGGRWTRVSAGELGADHLRERFFGLFANPDRQRLQRQWDEPGGIEKKQQDTGDLCRWTSEPGVDRMAHGLPNRIHRVKSLGNSVVPLAAETAFKRLMGYDNVG